MALGTEGYSAALVAKIEYAGANEESFQKAAENLAHVGDLSISVKHVQRITERLGRERAGQRDQQVEQMKARELQPTYRQPPQVVAAHLDAGKIRLRAEDGRPGVRTPHWSDTKVACLQTYTSVPCEQDPQPAPPALFLDPPRVVRLCQEMEQIRGNPATRPKAAKPDTPLLAETIGERPQRLVRTAVATMQGTEGFGWMVAAEALRRGFYQAPRRAVVGDGRAMSVRLNPRISRSRPDTSCEPTEQVPRTKTTWMMTTPILLIRPLGTAACSLYAVGTGCVRLPNLIHCTAPRPARPPPPVCCESTGNKEWANPNLADASVTYRWLP